MKPTLTLLTAFLLTSTISSAFGAQGIEKSEFIFDLNPVPSCHASTIVETSEGLLVAAWFAGTAEGKPDVGIWSARQIDGQWSAPVEVANGVQPDGKRFPCWNPVLFQPRRGPLMLFYKVGPHPAGWWGMLRTSSDNGKTWSEARRLPDKFQGPIKNKPVQLADGSILCPSSAEGLRPPPEWKIHFERTDEAAENWQHRSVPQPPGSPPAIQPSILHLGGNKLMALGRTKSGKVFSTSSDDSGTSWSAVTLLDLPNPNSGTDAVTLKDGRHLLVYNHTTKGRSPLNLAVSSDGKTWEAALVIEDTPAELSYPAIIQAADGLVHITYTWKRQSVKHVVMDPSRLEAKPMRNGEWSKADGEPLRTTPPGSLSHAGIEPQPLVPGAKLFADRDYAAAGLPTALKNAHFLPIAMEGEKKLECKRAGTVFFLTPSRNRSADSNAQALLDQGFAKVALQEIPLFLPESTQNHCTLYQKDCAAAETIIIGKWAVPVFFP